MCALFFTLWNHIVFCEAYKKCFNCCFMSTVGQMNLSKLKIIQLCASTEHYRYFYSLPPPLTLIVSLVQFVTLLFRCGLCVLLQSQKQTRTGTDFPRIKRQPRLKASATKVQVLPITMAMTVLCCGTVATVQWELNGK